MNLFRPRPSIACSTFATSLLVLVVCASGCSKSNPATTNGPTAPQAPAIEDAAAQPAADSGATSRAVADSDASNATNASLTTFSPEQAAAWLSTYNQKREIQQSALQLALSKLDPSLGTAEYQNALGRLAKSYPKAESADALKRVAIEAPLWESVDDWTALLRQVQGDSIASLAPKGARELTGRLRTLETSMPVQPYVDAIRQARPHIGAIASRIDLGDKPITRSLLNLLDSRLYSGVELVLAGDKQYYVLRDPEELPGDRRKVHYVVNENLDEKSIILPSKSLRGPGQPRHCKIADFLRNRLRDSDDVMTTEWEPTFIEFLDGLAGTNMQDATFNPMPVLMMYRQTLQVARSGSHRITEASEKHQEVLDAELPNLYDAAAWYHPTDRDGEDARNISVKILEKLSNLPPISDRVSKTMNAAPKGLPVNAKWVAYVGRTNAGQPTMMGNSPSADGQLYVVVQDNSQTPPRIRMIHVGDYANGKAKWKESEKEWLIEGRPLFLESGPSTAR